MSMLRIITSTARNSPRHCATLTPASPRHRILVFLLILSSPVFIRRGKWQVSERTWPVRSKHLDSPRNCSTSPSSPPASRLHAGPGRRPRGRGAVPEPPHCRDGRYAAGTPGGPRLSAGAVLCSETLPGLLSYELAPPRWPAWRGGGLGPHTQCRQG